MLNLFNIEILHIYVQYTHVFIYVCMCSSYMQHHYITDIMLIISPDSKWSEEHRINHDTFLITFT